MASFQAVEASLAATQNPGGIILRNNGYVIQSLVALRLAENWRDRHQELRGVTKSKGWGALQFVSRIAFGDAAAYVAGGRGVRRST
jgi:hypothetical protein